MPEPRPCRRARPLDSETPRTLPSASLDSETPRTPCRRARPPALYSQKLESIDRGDSTTVSAPPANPPQLLSIEKERPQPSNPKDSSPFLYERQFPNYYRLTRDNHADSDTRTTLEFLVANTKTLPIYAIIQGRVVSFLPMDMSYTSNTNGCMRVLDCCVPCAATSPCETCTRMRECYTPLLQYRN